MGDLAEDWLADYEKRFKYPNIPYRVYTKDLPSTIGGLAINQVNPRDIRAIIAIMSLSCNPFFKKIFQDHKSSACVGIKYCYYRLQTPISAPVGGLTPEF